MSIFDWNFTQCYYVTRKLCDKTDGVKPIEQLVNLCLEDQLEQLPAQRCARSNPTLEEICKQFKSHRDMLKAWHNYLIPIRQKKKEESSDVY